MPQPSAAKHDRRAIAALVAVFALMVQALIPAAAMAAQPDPSGVLTICTADRTHKLAPGDTPAAPRHRGFGGMPCQDCLAAAMAAVVADPIVAVEPVSYVVGRVDHAPTIRQLGPRARAPPRPPGQGPPIA
jgi:hypothetical protein